MRSEEQYSRWDDACASGRLCLKPLSLEVHLSMMPTITPVNLNIFVGIMQEELPPACLRNRQAGKDVFEKWA